MNARILPLLSLALLACSGAVAPLGPGVDAGPTDASSHDAAPPSDGDIPDGYIIVDASPPWSPVCPASKPAVGSACSDENLQCEYGDAWWNVACDAVLQCQQGKWQIDHVSYVPCTPAPGPNPAACPPSYADVPQGTSCNDNGESCVYSQAMCSCRTPLGPVFEDGGASWYCLPEVGCPMPRPRIGTGCTGAATYCTYAECEYSQECTNGVWQGQEEACAGAASGGSP
jgi:hypothetical protein